MLLPRVGTMLGSSQRYQSLNMVFTAGLKQQHRSRVSIRAAAALEQLPALPAAGSMLSSPTNPYIKHAVRLRESSRYRQNVGRLLLVGDTLLSELAGARCGVQHARLVATQGQRSVALCSEPAPPIHPSCTQPVLKRHHTAPPPLPCIMQAFSCVMQPCST